MMDAIPKTIVVPLDGSDFALRVVPIASTLAARFDADLVFMTTPLTHDEVGRTQPPAWLADAATQSRYAPARTMLAEDDHAASAITRVAQDLPNAVVCMTTHGHGRVARTALGHVAEDVVRHLRSASVLVGPHCGEWRGEHPMIVCHDGSSAADAILAPARAWAQALGLPIVLLHVFHPLDVESARDPTAAISEACIALGPKTTTRVVGNSYPYGAIKDVVDELEPSLIALSTHGRTGLARLALGSVATSVVHSSPYPALVVRPGDLGRSHPKEEDR